MARLCSECLRIFSSHRVELHGLLGLRRCKHHSNGSQLATAANQGCYICRKLWSMLNDAEKDRVRDSSWWSYLLLRWQFFSLFLNLNEGCYSWNLERGFEGVKFTFGLSYEGWKQLEFSIIPADKPTKFATSSAGSSDMSMNQPPTLRNYLRESELSESTGSEQTLGIVTGWWQHCQSQTWKRQHTIQASSFPTRLLDLAHDGLRDDLRLSVNADKRVATEYATLSYRWTDEGEQQELDPWLLQASTLRSMQARINFEVLPKTYQDAIIVCRRLGIRYLWIDGMCIIQANQKDWVDESKSMHLIYKFAALNIAAATGNRHAGLFFARRTRDLLVPEVDVVRGSFPEEWVYDPPTERRIRSYYIVDQYYSAGQRARAPLNGRGWVVGERMQSSCVLHFSREQVFWFEASNDACEVFPRGDPVPNDDLTSRGPPDRDFYVRHIGERKLDAWKELIAIYSRSSVTEPVDKVMAIMGLAQEFQEAMPNETYVAGLWESSLPLSLLWRVADGRDHKGRESYRSELFQSPSWSWLSISGSIKPFDGFDDFQHRDTAAKMIEYDVRPTLPGFGMGPLQPGASITLRGQVLSAKGWYWPLNSTSLYSPDVDHSQIEARIGWQRRIECSIDDMDYFLSIWSHPLYTALQDHEEWIQLLDKLWLYIAVIAYLPLARSESSTFEIINNLYVVLTFSFIVGLTIRKIVWHYTNFSDDNIDFLIVHKQFGDASHGDLTGLVLQRVHGNKYTRVGMFKRGRRDIFKNAVEKEVVIT